MSVDYKSVMIYGYKITAEEVARLIEDIGIDAWMAAREKYDGGDHYSLITDNEYEESDYYFGLTLSCEIELDAIDSLCWYEYEEGTLDIAFEEIFGSMSYVDTHSPKMYHFIRVC